jgi:hypothetical protein
MNDDSGTSADASLKALEEQHYSLYRQRDAMEAACKNEECRQAVWDQYSQARRNHDDCINKIFDQNNPEVVRLTKECRDETAQMNDALGDLQNMTRVLQVVTAAVKVGTTLASRAI